MKHLMCMDDALRERGSLVVIKSSLSRNSTMGIVVSVENKEWHGRHEFNMYVLCVDGRVRHLPGELFSIDVIIPFEESR